MVSAKQLQSEAASGEAPVPRHNSGGGPGRSAEAKPAKRRSHVDKPQEGDGATDEEAHVGGRHWPAAVQEELARLRAENVELRRAADRAREAASRGDAAAAATALAKWDAAGRNASPAPSPSSSPGPCSEGRLRAMLTSHNSSAAQLRQAIASVESLLQEARRELGAKELRERRAAYEHLHTTTDRGDEASLPQAIEAAIRSGVDSDEIERAEAKLRELQAMTPKQRAAKAAKELEGKQKKEAFVLVKKDNVPELEELLDSLPPDVRWQNWKDHAGRNLFRCAQDLRSAQVHDFLAARLGKQPLEPKRQFASPKPSKPSSFVSAVSSPEKVMSARERTSPGSLGSTGALVATDEVADDARERRNSDGGEIQSRRVSLSLSEPQSPSAMTSSPSKPLELTEEDKVKARAFKAVVQDEGEELEKVLDMVPIETISDWKNKAGTSLLTLAEERGSAQAYSVLAKAMGMVREIKRDYFEERETVWVFVQGDVQPKRATVLEDTPEESDTVLLEFWDGTDPAERVDRNRIRRMWS